MLVGGGVFLHCWLIRKAGVEEIRACMEKALFHNDFDFSREHPKNLDSQKRAEKLELFTYVCPACREFESLVSRENQMKCSCCGWTLYVDENGRFSRDEALPFSHDLVRWGRWQHSVAEDFICRKLAEPAKGGHLLLHRKEVSLFTGEGLSPLKLLSSGELRLYSDRLEFGNARKTAHAFFWASMEGLSLFKRQKLEFYYEKTLYRFHFTRPGDSAWIWQEFMELLMLHRKKGTVQSGNADTGRNK